MREPITAMIIMKEKKIRDYKNTASNKLSAKEPLELTEGAQLQNSTQKIKFKVLKCYSMSSVGSQHIINKPESRKNVYLRIRKNQKLETNQEVMEITSSP
jgi:hypothetical protein